MSVETQLQLQKVDDLMCTEEVASYVGRSVSWLEKARATAMGPKFIYVSTGWGPVVRYPSTCVEQFLPGGIESYWTAVEAAEVLGCCRRSLDGWSVNDSGPPYIREGKRVLYPKDALQTWRDERAAKNNPFAGCL